MQNIMMKFLLVGGIGAVALTLALLLRPQMEGFHRFVRRLSNLERALFAGFLAVFVAYGGTKPTPPEEPDDPPEPPAPAVYAIAYELDGGVNAEGNPTSYTTNDLPIVLTAPTREGYDFAGWEPSGEIAVGTTGDQTFTATWTKHEDPPEEPEEPEEPPEEPDDPPTPPEEPEDPPEPPEEHEEPPEEPEEPPTPPEEPEEPVDPPEQPEEPDDPTPSRRSLLSGLTEIDKDAFPATTYNGYLYDEATGDVAGTIQVKAAKAKLNKKLGATTTKLAISIQLAAEAKKISISGEYDLGAGGAQSFATKGRTVVLTLGANGLTGAFEGCAVEGVVNVFSLKDADSKRKAGEAESRYVGAYNVFAEEGAFTVTVAKKGKVKLSGMLAGGTKVSAAAQLLVGEGGACVPFAVAKQGLAFAVWFGEEDETSVVGLADAIAGPSANINIVGSGDAFHVDAEALLVVLRAKVSGMEKPLAEFIPNGLSVVPNGRKWLVAGGAKAGKIKYDKVSGEVWDDKASANPAGLSLSYSAKAGTFTGSFKVYGVVKGKLKSYTAKVTGVLVDGRGYGYATISKVGSAKVWIGSRRHGLGR